MDRTQSLVCCSITEYCPDQEPWVLRKPEASRCSSRFQQNPIHPVSMHKSKTESAGSARSQGYLESTASRNTEVGSPSYLYCQPSTSILRPPRGHRPRDRACQPSEFCNYGGFHHGGFGTGVDQSEDMAGAKTIEHDFLCYTGWHSQKSTMHSKFNQFGALSLSPGILSGPSRLLYLGGGCVSVNSAF